MVRDIDNERQDSAENTDAVPGNGEDSGSEIDAAAFEKVDIEGAGSASEGTGSNLLDWPECTECGADFESEHAMKTHRGKSHPGWDEEQEASSDGGGTDREQGDEDPFVEMDPMDPPDSLAERADERERAQRSADRRWEDAREAFEMASISASDVTRREALELVVEALLKETEWMSVARRSKETTFDLWHWTEDGWQDNGHAYVRERMVAELSTDADTRTVKKAVMQIATLNTVEEETLNGGRASETLIPVLNGAINIDAIAYDSASGEIEWDDIELQEMDSEYRFTYRVRTEWDPDGADVEGLDEWLETITRHEEARRIIWEFAGHSIHPGYPVDGFLVLLGDGGSGKSQVLKLIKQMLGEKNTSARSITDLETNRFAGTDVVDSRANINTELQGTKLPSIALLKTYSAGEEASVEEKMMPSYDSKNDATMLFASDDPPAFPTRNAALGRRLYPVEFPYSYVENPDPSNPYELEHRPKLEVKAELQAEARCKAALLRAVEGLVRLLDTGRFSSSKSREERVQQYESYADPIHDFSRVCLESVSDENAEIEASVLKGTFDRFADAKGHDGKAMQQVSRVLDEAPGITFGKGRTRAFADDQTKHTVYSGLRFTAEALASFVPETADRSKLDTSNASDADDTRPAGNDVEVGESSRVTLTDLAGMSEGTKDGKAVAVTVAADHAPRYQREAAGELTDGAEQMEYFSRSDEHLLEEGKSYVIQSPAVIEEHGDSVLKLRAAGTTVHEVSTSGTAIDDFDVSRGGPGGNEVDANGSEESEESVTARDSEDDGHRRGPTSDTDRSPGNEEVQTALEEVIDELAVGDGPEGADRDAVFDIVAERTGASAATIDQAFDDLRRGGYVYEVVDERLKMT
jgi:phage/plasmid-associated DNA primase